MVPPTPEITILPPRAQLGECPVWDEPTQSLFWIDIRAPTLHQTAPDGTPLKAWTLHSPIGAFALLEPGTHALAVLRTGLAILDLETAIITPLHNPESHLPANRFNEGKVSPCGQHFLFGSMDDRPDKSPTGALYALSANGTLRTLARDITVANGLAWSPDAQTLYFSDSRAATIWACPWHPDTGTIGPRRVFATPVDAIGRPDGAAMDTEGHYWSAGVSAARLNRFAPDGTLARSIPLPVQAPTMPVFGGPARNRLFVTSHRHVPQPTPIDGALLSLDPAATGTPARRFALSPAASYIS